MFRSSTATMFLGHFDVAQLSVILDHSGIFWVGLALQVLELEVSTLLLFRAALEQPNARGEMLNLIVLGGHAVHTAHTHTVHTAHAAMFRGESGMDTSWTHLQDNHSIRHQLTR